MDMPAFYDSKLVFTHNFLVHDQVFFDVLHVLFFLLLIPIIFLIPFASAQESRTFDIPENSIQTLRFH